MVNNEDSRFDKRVIDRNIARGIVSKAEYEEYLDNIPDLLDKCEYIFYDEEDKSFAGVD